MKKILKDKGVLIGVAGIIIVVAAIGLIAFNVLATEKAVVPVSTIKAGETITDNMVKEIDVPKDTPGDYFKNKKAVIGERVTTTINEGQLIYPRDIMSSVEIKNSTDPDFLTTSIRIPDDHAVAGLLTAGDVVDISVIPESSKVGELQKALPGYEINSSLGGGCYFILSNVKILDATTAVSANNGSNLSSANGESDGSTKATAGNKDSYYIVSLSYDDYKKLRLAEQFGDLYLTLTPAQNKDNPPLLKEMKEQPTSGLNDAAGREDKKKTERK